MIKIRSRVVAGLTLVCLCLILPSAGLAQDSGYFSSDQLDNLLAPIALYPDPLLAQVLLAATFPDQIDEASRYIRGGADPNSVDAQGWDVSVKAVAHYPQVLYMMADKLDWTTALGQAYVNQSTDVMASVQRLRQEAYSVGNLATTAEEQVVDTDGEIQIWPAQPQYIYVPVYDPAVIYFGRGYGSGIRFGARFAIGAWLNFDFDWRNRRVFYHGWSGSEGWEARSRPFIHQDNVYVNNNLRNVQVNRAVIDRPVNYSSLNRYNAVHRDVNYNNVRAGERGAPNPAPAQNRPVNNKIIERNINPNDSRIEQFRGHPDQQPAINRPEPAPQPNRIQFEPNRAQPQPNPPPQPNRVQPEPNRGQFQVNQGQPNRPEPNRPAPQPQQQPQAVRAPERPAPLAFGGNRSAFNPGEASSRGQASRAEMARPAPPPPPPPRQERPQAPPPSNPPAGRGRR